MAVTTLRASVSQASRVGTGTGSPANFTPQFRKEFQEILKQRGYYNGPIDGDFGASTQNAIDRLAART